MTTTNLFNKLKMTFHCLLIELLDKTINCLNQIVNERNCIQSLFNIKLPKIIYYFIFSKRTINKEIFKRLTFPDAQCLQCHRQQHFQRHHYWDDCPTDVGDPNRPAIKEKKIFLLNISNKLSHISL